MVPKLGTMKIEGAGPVGEGPGPWHGPWGPKPWEGYLVEAAGPMGPGPGAYPPRIQKEPHIPSQIRVVVVFYALFISDDHS